MLRTISTTMFLCMAFSVNAQMCPFAPGRPWNWCLAQAPSGCPYRPGWPSNWCFRPQQPSCPFLWGQPSNWCLLQPPMHMQPPIHVQPPVQVQSQPLIQDAPYETQRQVHPKLVGKPQIIPNSYIGPSTPSVPPPVPSGMSSSISSQPSGLRSAGVAPQGGNQLTTVGSAILGSSAIAPGVFVDVQEMPDPKALESVEDTKGTLCQSEIVQRSCKIDEPKLIGAPCHCIAKDGTELNGEVNNE